MESGFYFEKPIDSIEDDKYGFDKHAITVSKSLLQMPLHESYTLTINGEWGSGKTSFVNLIINHLKDSIELDNEKIIIINFDTSLFQNSKEMISEYFKQLFSNLNKEKKINKSNEFNKLVKSFIEYGDKISLSIETFSSESNLFVKFWRKIKSIYNIWVNKSEIKLTLQESKNKLSKLLLKSKYKFIVIIDDMDRLPKKQVRRIFQLIYSLCKLPNHTFVLPFDKKIVSNCINNAYGIENGESYIEKIIQREINVPEIGEKKIEDSLFKTISKAGIKIDFSNKDYIRVGYNICIKPLIRNIRDLKRLCDNFIFISTLTSSILNQFDLLILSTIKLKAPNLYEYISVNRFKLAAGKNPVKYMQDIENDVFGETVHSPKDSYGTLREELKIYKIKEENEQKYSKKVLDFLFPNYYEYYDGERERFGGVQIKYLAHEHHICDINYINSFFSSEFRNDIISFSQLDEVLTKYNEEKVFNYISSIIDKDICGSILKEIKSYITIKELEEQQKKKLVNAFAELYDLYGVNHNILFGIFRTLIEEYSDKFDSTLVHLEYLDEKKLYKKVRCLSKYFLHLDRHLETYSPFDLNLKISNLRVSLFYQLKEDKDFYLFYYNGNNDVYLNLQKTIEDCDPIKNEVHNYINQLLLKPENMIGFILSEEAKQKWSNDNKYPQVMPTRIQTFVEQEFPKYTNITNKALQYVDQFLNENTPESIGNDEYNILTDFEDRFEQ